MSIIAQTTREIAQAATQPADDPLALFWILTPLALLALALARRLGIFRSSSIVGPPRLDDDEPLGIMLMFLGLGVLTLILGQVGVITVTSRMSAFHPVPAVPPPTTQQGGTETSLEQLALLISVPSLISFAIVLLFHAFFRKAGLRRLGLTASQLHAGVVKGLLGSCVMIPLVFFVAQVTELFWRMIGYTHPAAHELLYKMRAAENPALIVALVLSAVVCAPLFEEFMFRGHLQTLLTYFSSRWRAPVPVPRGFDYNFPGAVPPVPAELIVPTFEPPQPPSIAARWFSIVLTSLGFAAIHPGFWMMPPIFFLSLCVGYAYERTGNLWTVITMHAAFNSLSTILYFLVMQ